MKRLSRLAKYMAMAIFAVVAALIPAKEAYAASYTDGNYTFEVDGNGNATISGYTGSETAVIIPDTLSDGTTSYPVVKIGNEVFMDNTTIQELTISANIEEIGEDAFGSCTSLKVITFAENSRLKTIGKWAFFKTAVETVKIPASVETMTTSFMKCESLATVTFEEGSVLKTIGNNCFEGTAVESIEIPASVETIEIYAFLDCKSLTAVTFEEGSKLTTIGRSAFCNTRIGEIVLPAGVAVLDDKPFRRSSSLMKIYYPDTLASQVDELDTGYSISYRAAYTVSDTIPATVIVTYYDIADNVTTINVPDTIDGMSVATVKEGDVVEPDSNINVANTVKKLSGVTLPTGWSFKTTDLENQISVGGSVTATVTYQGDISYSKAIEKEITITRENCTMQIYYTGAGEKAPSCKETGNGHEECTLCGEVGQSVTVPATGHLHTAIKNQKSATCKEEGYTGDTYCTDCNTKLSSGSSIAKTSEHIWDEGKVTQKATETENGVKTYTCTVCSITKTEDISKLETTTKNEEETKSETESEEKTDSETVTEETPATEGEIAEPTETESDSENVTTEDVDEKETLSSETELVTAKESGFNVWFVLVPAIIVAIAAVGIFIVLKKNKKK